MSRLNNSIASHFGAMIRLLAEERAEARIADRVAVMRAGRIEEHGACDRVLSDPRQAYTRQLWAAVSRLAAPIHG